METFSGYIVVCVLSDGGISIEFCENFIELLLLKPDGCGMIFAQLVKDVPLDTITFMTNKFVDYKAYETEKMCHMMMEISILCSMYSCFKEK